MALPRFLLLQARKPEDVVRREEWEAFVSKSGLPAENIVPYDLLQGPPAWSLVRTFDGLFVGGSGEFNISDRSLPHLEATLTFMGEVADRGFPTFASCFGFQLLVQALGGRIIRDEANAEVGTFRVCLTQAGRQDPLFSQLPECFDAQLGHKERADRWPAGLLNLAYSDRSPYQALRVPERPIWATQFHPELDHETNLLRFRRYEAIYKRAFGEEGYREMLARFRPSPHTEGLLRAFLHLVFGVQP